MEWEWWSGVMGLPYVVVVPSPCLPATPVPWPRPPEGAPEGWPQPKVERRGGGIMVVVRQQGNQALHEVECSFATPAMLLLVGAQKGASIGYSCCRWAGNCSCVCHSNYWYRGFAHCFLLPPFIDFLLMCGLLGALEGRLHRPGW